jgi:hypothetical protein
VGDVGAQAVVIDTLGRAVRGPENEADTIRDFYRYTGMALKRHGIGFLRIDHAGKDAKKGQRGSSAKRDDVDVIWRQHRTEGGLVLDCSGSSRLSWVRPILAVDRVVDPATGIISYSAPISMEWPAGTAEKMEELDRAQVPLDASRSEAISLLRNMGCRPGRTAVLVAALRARRSVFQPGNRSSDGAAAE